MDDQENNSGKKKTWIVPLFWFGGILLTGGVVALALMYYEKNSEIKTLEQKFTTAEITFSREKDSLSKELKLSSDNYKLLASDNDVLSVDLAKEKLRNSRMAYDIAVNNAREQKILNKYDSLRLTNEKVNTEKETLKSEIAKLLAMVDHLKELLFDRDKQTDEQLALIEQQTATMKADSIASATLRDSLRREDVAGYFNNTELTGAYGVSMTNLPYSHYYAGINTVNGYVINKHFLTGLGVGLSYYDAGWMAPVYLDFRYRFNQSKYTPYIFADGGFLVDLEDVKLPYALFMNPGVGVYRNINDHFSLNLGAGLFVQKFDIRSSFVNIKLGVTFKK